MRKISVEKAEKLNIMKKELNKYIEIIDDILAGTAETTACKNRDVKPNKFRHIVDLVSDVNHYVVSEDENKLDIYVCPQEQMVLDAGLFNSVDEMPADIVENVDEVVSTVLDKRSQTLMYDLYFDGCTLRECSDKYQVTVERIRQIKFKALRKLRSRHSLLRNGKASRLKLEADRLERKRQKIALDIGALLKAETDYDTYSKMRNTIIETIGYEKANELNELVKDKPETITLKYILTNHGDKMSARLYNCIYRALNGYYVDNMYKLPINELTLADLFRMRNVGRKTVEELVDILKEYGWNGDI